MNLSQDQQSVSVYFTKLKTIWEELNLYKPVCNCGKCTCKGVTGLHAYHQMECTMPTINKVFSLVSQEVHQGKLGIPTSDTGNPIAFTVKTNIPKSNSEKFGTYKTNFAATNEGQNQNTNYKGQKRERLFAHIVIFLAIQLIDVTNSMVLHLDIIHDHTHRQMLLLIWLIAIRSKVLQHILLRLFCLIRMYSLQWVIFYKTSIQDNTNNS